MKPKRIGLFANCGWNFLNYRRELIEALSSKGYEIHLIAPDFPAALSNLGELHELKLSAAGMNLVKEVGVVYRLSRLLSSLQLDCLLTFTIKPNLYGSLAAGEKTKVICNITGLGEMFHSRRGPRSLVLGKAYRYALSKCSIAFVQNPADAVFLQQRGLLPSEKIKRLPGSGVNTRFFAPVETHERHGETRFLFVGRFRKDKGFFEFVSAAKDLLSRHENVAFTMVGASEPGRKYSVSPQAISEIRQAGQIKIVDFQEDIRPYIGACDCLVLPSSYPEGLSRSLLEAASMAKPVITMDVSGCREAVVDRESGYLCSPDSPRSLVEAMGRFHRLDPIAKQLMGKAGRRHVLENFCVEKVIEIYSNQITSLLGREKPMVSVSRSFGCHESATSEVVNTDV